MERLTAENFQPHVGKSARFTGTPHILKLDRVELSAAARDAFVPFIAIFQGPMTPDYLAGGIYDCAIEGGPTYNIHISPMQSETSGLFEYQAIFN